MNLPRLQSIIAPVTTPAAPAVLLANELYRAMIAVEIGHYIALSSSIVAIVGIEFTGALMCYNALEAYRRRSWGPMALAIGGAILYAAIVIAGIASMPEARGRVFGVMVLLTLVAYVGYAIFEAFGRADEAAVTGITLDIEQLNARRALVNAETRKAKIEAQNVPALDMSVLSSVKLTEVDSQIDITPAGKQVIDYLDANNGAGSLRKIAGELGISHQTVAHWREYWQKNRAAN